MQRDDYFFLLLVLGKSGTKLAFYDKGSMLQKFMIFGHKIDI